MLSQSVNVDNADLPRTNIIRVIDDGSKGQLIIDVESDADATTPVKIYDYENNIISFNVNNRKIPTTVIIRGKKGQVQTFRHASAASALGENFITVKNNKLKSPAECIEFAQKIFRANLKAQYEYTLSTYDGAYLEENDVIRIIDDTTDVNGNFRIIGKTINFSPNLYSLQLTINKRPPILAEFFKTS